MLMERFTEMVAAMEGTIDVVNAIIAAGIALAAGALIFIKRRVSQSR